MFKEGKKNAICFNVGIDANIYIFLVRAANTAREKSSCFSTTENCLC